MSDITVKVVGAVIAVSIAATPVAVKAVGQQGPAGPGVPGGSTGRVLFGDIDGLGANVVGTSSKLLFDKTTGQLTVDGNVSATGYVHHSSSNSALSSAGVQAGSAAAIGFSSLANATGTMDTMLRRGGAGIIEQYDGTNPQTYRLYNKAGVDFERGGFRWASDTLFIESAAGGAGVVRPIAFFLGGLSRARIVADGTWELSSGSRASSVNGMSAGYDATGGFLQSWASKPLHLNAAGNTVFLGANVAAFSATLGGAGLGSGMSLGWASAADPSGTADVRLWRDGAGVLSLRNGAAAQTFRMYESFTDAANYSRLGVNYNPSALSFHIAAQAAGTGTLRGLILDGTQVLFATSGITRYAASATDFSPYTNTGTDNTLDLGKSATRWRNGYFGTDLFVGRVATINASGTGGPTTGLVALTIKGPSSNNAWGGDIRLSSFDGTSVTSQIVADNSGLLFRWMSQNAWRINAAGHWLPEVDNANDLAHPTVKVRSGHFGTSVNSPRVEGATITFGGAGVNNAVIGAAALGLTSAHFLGWAAGADANAGTWDTRLHRDGAGLLALRGSVAAVFNVYNTYTDAANFERGRFGFASNVLVIGAEAAGTGVQRAMRFNAANIELQFAGTSRWLFDNGPVTLRPIDDNTNDIGTAAQRIKVGYFVTVSASNISASSGITSSTFGVTGVASGYNVNRRDNNNLGFQLYSGAGELNFYSGVAAAVKATLSANGDFAASGAITTTGGGIGYATGAGGTVTQLTSKSTAVTLNKLCGEITMNAGSLAANTPVQFTLSNSVMGANDNMVIQHVGGGTLGAYSVVGACGGGAGTINVRNLTAGALAEAIVLRFTIIKSVNS